MYLWKLILGKIVAELHWTIWTRNLKGILIWWQYLLFVPVLKIHVVTVTGKISPFCREGCLWKHLCPEDQNIYPAWGCKEEYKTQLKIMLLNPETLRNKTRTHLAGTLYITSILGLRNLRKLIVGCPWTCKHLSSSPGQARLKSFMWSW